MVEELNLLWTENLPRNSSGQLSINISRKALSSSSIERQSTLSDDANTFITIPRSSIHELVHNVVRIGNLWIMLAPLPETAHPTNTSTTYSVSAILACMLDMSGLFLPDGTKIGPRTWMEFESIVDYSRYIPGQLSWGPPIASGASAKTRASPLSVGSKAWIE